MDVNEMIADAVKGAEASKATWDEARTFERARVLKCLGPVFNCLDEAPEMVQRLFAACLRQVLELKPNSTTTAVKRALLELGFAPKEE